MTAGPPGILNASLAGIHHPRNGTPFGCSTGCEHQVSGAHQCRLLERRHRIAGRGIEAEVVQAQPEAQQTRATLEEHASN
jgi:hypothetical protein